MRNVKAMLTDRLWLSLIGVIAVLVLTVAYLFNNVLDTPILRGTKTVKVELPQTGGLFTGSAVTYRGVKVGKVSSIKLAEDGVVASVVISAPDDIPVDSLVKVRSLSPVGEQYLDFQPRTSKGPFLRDGSVIPATSTDLPKTLASTVIAVNKLLDQIDATQLHTLLTELSTGLAGTGQDLGKLVDQGSVLLADLNRLWPETDRLIANGGTVLDIGTDKANEIRQLATSSRQFAAFLKSYDPRLRRTLDTAPAQVRQLQLLVDDIGAKLPPFLGQAVRFSDLFRPYSPHLGALLATYAPGLGTLSTAIHGGFLNILGIPQRPTGCYYGTPVRDPRSTERRPLVSDKHCPASQPNLQRGAAHAPGPVG
ncbi:MAG: MCE family protein [Nocardioidaceae bacterium]|nr:MCE family protein [Nocardioidaceae bacterium]